MGRPVSNPPNPWSTVHVEWLGEPPAAALEVFEEEAKSVLTRNESPDLSFRWSVNPYRGCFHACAYCYARRSHQYLGFGAGTDFERKLVVKTNAPEALRRELGKRSWAGELILFSGDTDCYQPLEASYGLTRRCLEAALERRNPVGVITKNELVRRDADVLARLAAEAGARVFLSIPFRDDATARLVEPQASPPSRRFAALRALADAGVPVGVSLAPTIPGLNDADLPEVLERAREAGARWAFHNLVRLSGEVLPVFVERLRAAFPDRADKVLAAIREARGGDKMSESAFGARMRGTGARWELTAQLFRLHARRLGFEIRE